jgi:RNA polymerase-binding transcription factor DksA
MINQSILKGVLLRAKEEHMSDNAEKKRREKLKKRKKERENIKKMAKGGKVLSKLSKGKFIIPMKDGKPIPRNKAAESKQRTDSKE